MRLRVTYRRSADFLADVEQQVSRRGLLVRVEVSAERGAPLELELVTPAGRVVLPAAVIQPLGASGIAVELDPAALTELVARVRAEAPVDGGEPPRHERVADEPEPEPEPELASEAELTGEPTQAQLQAKKIQLALHGDKNQRMAILREPNKLFHGYVLRNPQLQLEEVVFVARMTTAAVDLLQFIAARREWAERPEVAIALVRNPKTPVPLAVKLLDFIAEPELRAIAKQQSLREGIQRAARKKLLG